MTEAALADLYRAYIACLNRQDWPNLDKFVADYARHNGRALGFAGYRAMLERDYEDIPDLKFVIELMVCEPPHVAAPSQQIVEPLAKFGVELRRSFTPRRDLNLTHAIHAARLAWNSLGRALRGGPLIPKAFVQT